MELYDIFILMFVSGDLELVKDNEIENFRKDNIGYTKSVMRIWLSDVVAGLATLLSQQPLEVLGRKRDYLCLIGGVLFNNCF